MAKLYRYIAKIIKNNGQSTNSILKPSNINGKSSNFTGIREPNKQYKYYSSLDHCDSYNKISNSLINVDSTESPISFNFKNNYKNKDSQINLTSNSVEPTIQ